MASAQNLLGFCFFACASLSFFSGFQKRRFAWFGPYFFLFNFRHFSGCGFAWLGLPFRRVPKTSKSYWGSAFSHARPKHLFLEFGLVACRLPSLTLRKGLPCLRQPFFLRCSSQFCKDLLRHILLSLLLGVGGMGGSPSIVREAKELEATICHFSRAFLAYREPSRDFTHESVFSLQVLHGRRRSGLGQGLLAGQAQDLGALQKQSRKSSVRRNQHHVVLAGEMAVFAFDKVLWIQTSTRFSVFVFLSSSTSLYCKTSSAS